MPSEDDMPNADVWARTSGPTGSWSKDDLDWRTWYDREFPEPPPKPKPVKKKPSEIEYQMYWAYGSNLCKSQMLRRCPDAIPLEGLAVKNLILRFRGVADVAARNGSVCQGGLWLITPDCEAELDLYEGVRSGLYRKLYFPYRTGGMTHQVLYYKMQRRGIMPPSEGYLESIVQGYRDFRLSTRSLRRAFEHSWRRKDVTPYLQWRRERERRPKLAEQISLRKLNSETDDVTN